MLFQRQVGCIKGLFLPWWFQLFLFLPLPWKFGHFPCFGTQLKQPTSYTPPQKITWNSKKWRRPRWCVPSFRGGITRFQPLFFQGIAKKGATNFTNIITYIYIHIIHTFLQPMFKHPRLMQPKDVPPNKMDNVCWGHGCAPAETMDLPPEMLGVETPLVPGDVSLAAWISEVLRNSFCWIKRNQKEIWGKDSLYHCCFLLKVQWLFSLRGNDGEHV